MKIEYNKGNNVSSVAFMFACPGQKEQAAGRVVAGATGKNLDMLLSVLMESENIKISSLFPSANRYDYLITNAMMKMTMTKEDAKNCSGIIPMYVTKLVDNCFQFCEYTKIIIPTTIKELPNDCFRECYK